MGKFSDSPYFLLKDFFGGSGAYTSIIRPINDYQWPVIWTDRDYVTFEDHNQVVWNLRYYYDPNAPNTDGSYLVGMECNIIAKGDGLVELWVKETELLDVPVTSPLAGRGEEFLPVTLRWDRLEDNVFYFNDSDLCNQTEGDPVTAGWPLTGAMYNFDLYDGGCLGFLDIINNNREVYFRKDSIYHEWLTTFAQTHYPDARGHETDIRNYTNSDKVWSYFGKIYKDQDTRHNEFRVIFDGLREYVMRAIPEHQRTTNFKKFTEIFFDQKYHEIYNQIKQVWTLLDPMEIDEDFLGYLSKYYHMFDLISPTLFKQREFVRDLIWLLKRKGTYVEFYVIWRVLANTVNALNIYEKWHEKEIINGVHSPALSADGDTHVQNGEWQEFIYVEKPEYRFQKEVGGADIGWYNRYYGLSGESIVNTMPPSAFYNYPVKLNNNPMEDVNGETNLEIPLPLYQVYPEDRILSTHYKVEIDVSTEPLLPDAIVNKVLWDELWQYWDFLRPVNRVVDYNILMAPITDFSGQFIELYEYAASAFDKTKLLVDLRTDTGWVDIHTIYTSGGCGLSAEPGGYSPSGGCTWIIDHPLNSKYLHTMAVNENFEQMIPDDIEIVDATRVIMYWDEPTVGYGLVKKSDQWNLGGNPVGGDWNLYHYLGTNQIILEAHEEISPSGTSTWKVFSDTVDNLGLSAADGIAGNDGEVDTDIASVNTGQATNSIVPASSGSYLYIQPLGQEAGTWTIPHHQYYRGVIVAVYNWNHKQIHQYELTLNHIDECIIEFDSSIYDTVDGVSGYVVLIPVANFSLEDLMDEFIRIMLNNAIWLGAENRSDLPSNYLTESGTWSASGDVETTEVYETDEFIYINIKVPKPVESEFKEFGLYNDNGDLMVYTKHSPLYKSADTTLVLHFRIEKTAVGNGEGLDSKYTLNECV